MSELTRKQARIIRRQIHKMYGRNYIPLTTGDSTLTIGDVLLRQNDISPIVDSSVFNPDNVSFVEGNKINKNITSDSNIDITTKLKGEALLLEHFKLGEAGISVQFNSSNQMFLKVQGMRQQSIKNFVAFRKELLSKYVKGELAANVCVVRGLVYADKYVLQYSGSNGGNIGFSISGKIPNVNADVNADFTSKWRKDVGYHIDAPTGGVLAYRVSGVRLKRHLMPSSVQKNILKGISEADALNSIAFAERKKLLDKEAFEVVDLTDQVLLAQNDFMG